MNNSITHF